MQLSTGVTSLEYAFWLGRGRGDAVSQRKADITTGFRGQSRPLRFAYSGSMMEYVCVCVCECARAGQY